MTEVRGGDLWSAVTYLRTRISSLWRGLQGAAGGSVSNPRDDGRWRFAGIQVPAELRWVKIIICNSTLSISYSGQQDMRHDDEYAAARACADPCML